MKISMLMPVYRVPPDLLAKALASVFSQTHTDFEVIIRDGSLEHPAVEDARIKFVLDNPGSHVIYSIGQDSRDDIARRSGFYQALNWCMRNARGDIFSFLAGDDERGVPEVLEWVNERFEAHGPSPFLLYGDCDKIRYDSSLDVVVPPGQMRPVSNPITYEEMMRSNMLCTPAVFWNRAVVEKFGYFDETFDWAADIEYWLRIWRGIDKEYLPKSIGRYRDWETSQNAKNGGAAHEQMLRAQERYR